MAIERIQAEIESFYESSIDLFRDVIAQPSISATGEGIEECAELVKNTLIGFGIPARIIPTNKHPIVYGERLDGGKGAVTMIYYGHYDTMPADPVEEWATPPFLLTIKDGRAYGRGAADNKGLFIAGLSGMRAYLKAEKKFPINIKVVIDGEEECGSPSISQFIKHNKEMLKANLVFNIDGGYYIDNPQLLYGVRGNLVTELHLETATSNNHSGLRGNVIPEASFEMIKILAALRDEHGRIAIPGFYENVVPPTTRDLELIDAIPYYPDDIAKACGVKSIDYSAREYFTRLMFEPTLTINGINSGYLGEGVLMCIPGKATAKISMRLVKNQDPDDIFKKYSTYLKSLNPEIEVTQIASCAPSRTPTDFAIADIIRESLKTVYGRDTISIPSDGGTAPDYVWTKDLGVASLIAPLANDDCKSHSANENICLDLYKNVQYAIAQIIYDLGLYSTTK